MDERLGLGTLIDEHLSDSREGLNKKFPLADLLRQSVYSRLAGYEDLNDAARVSADPTFRLIGSEKNWNRGAALTSTLHGFETGTLTSEDNLLGLMAAWQRPHRPGKRPACLRPAVVRSPAAIVHPPVESTKSQAMSRFAALYQDEHGEAAVNSVMARRTEFWWNERKPDQPSLWESKIELGEDLFYEIISHPVPIDMNKHGTPSRLLSPVWDGCAT